MNEELKIVIKAVTDSAKKSIKEVRGELDKMGASAKSSSGKLGAAMKGVAKGAAIAVAAIVAVGAAVVALGKKSLETIKEQAKLITSFQAVGASAKTAETTYKGFYRFLGDKGKATEAAAHLAKLAKNQEQLAEWTKISQGVYATFGDSLPIEGLTEAANETLKVGKVTGTLADALNWAGVSEDEFNAKLAATSSYEEREALLRSTLNGLYGEAAELYEKNNKALLDYNESQARVDSSLARTGAVITPLLTALNNLSAVLLDALKPALEFIIPIFASVINWISQATMAVTAFFSAVTGKSSSVKATAKDIQSAASSAGSLGAGMGAAKSNAAGAAVAIDKAKRAAMGFDELNIVSSGTTSSGGTGTGSSAPTYAQGGGFNQEYEAEIEQAEGTNSKFIDNAKAMFSELATLFEPTKTAWTKAFEDIKESWGKAKADFINGANDIKSGFGSLITYIGSEFIPDIVNSFSTNLAPIFSDLFGFALEEGAKQFKWFGSGVKTTVHDIVLPAFDSLKMVVTDVFEVMGNVWAKYGEPLMTQLSTALEKVRGHFTNLYNVVIKPVFDKVKKTFDDVWKNTLKPVFEQILSSLAGIGEDLLILYNKVIAPIVDWIIKKIGPYVVKAVNSIIDIVKNLITTVSNVVAGVVKVLEGLVGFIVGVFTGDWKKAWQGIKDAFGSTWDIIVSIAQGAWNLIKDTFKNSVSYFKSIWNDIKAVFSTVGTWFKDIFSTAWTNIKNVFAPVGQFFSDLWDKVKKKFSSLGTTIGDAISSSVKSGINGIIRTIEKTINKAINLINGAIDLINKIPGVDVGKISELSLPRLAKGGIADSATAAIIGEAGREAVLPLDRNTEWMDRLADRIAARNNTPSKIVLQIGEKELGWATIGAINGITSQTGRLQLAL